MPVLRVVRYRNSSGPFDHMTLGDILQRLAAIAPNDVHAIRVIAEQRLTAHLTARRLEQDERRRF